MGLGERESLFLFFHLDVMPVAPQNERHLVPRSFPAGLHRGTVVVKRNSSSNVSRLGLCRRV